MEDAFPRRLGEDTRTNINEPARIEFLPSNPVSRDRSLEKILERASSKPHSLSSFFSRLLSRVSPRSSALRGSPWRAISQESAKSSDDRPPNAVPTVQSCFRTLFSGFRSTSYPSGFPVTQSRTPEFAGCGVVCLLN